MVLLRILSFVMLFGVLSFNESRAFPIENEAKTPQSACKKRTRETVKENEQPSPFSIYSPETSEIVFLSPIRRALVLADTDTVNTDFVRSLHPREKLEKFYKCTRVNGKTVYKRDKLFDLHVLVLSKEGKWETNFERMKRGLCPVGNKGIVLQEEANLLSHNDIRKRQKPFQIELHHITQKDTGTDDDALRETTKAAHLGLNARFFVEDDADNKRKIIASRLRKEDANLLLEKHKESNAYIMTNVLHPRKGPSLIDRSAFATWRISYWKARAEGFEEKVQKSSLKRSKVKKSFQQRIDEAEQNKNVSRETF